MREGWTRTEDEWLFPANHLTAEEAEAEYAMAAEALPPGADPTAISEQEFNPLQGCTRMLMDMKNAQYLRKFIPVLEIQHSMEIGEPASLHKYGCFEFPLGHSSLMVS